MTLTHHQPPSYMDPLTRHIPAPRRAEALARFVSQLQEELLGYPTDVGPIELAVGYRPAAGDIGFGGDWYDVVAVDDDTTALVVGDIAGHGISAAAQMAQTKGVLRALIQGSHDHADVFKLATRTLAHLDAVFVGTAAVAVLDRGARRLRWSTAGHLPPLLRTASGSVELLWSERQPPIGLATKSVALSERPVDLGSWLVLYTDGLVERRGSALDDRLHELCTFVGRLEDSCSPEQVRDRVLEAMVGEGASDDVAIVVARIR